jgi:hypothetical protein
MPQDESDVADMIYNATSLQSLWLLREHVDKVECNNLYKKESIIAISESIPCNTDIQ